jgi:hypothetical protein
MSDGAKRKPFPLPILVSIQNFFLLFPEAAIERPVAEGSY